MALRRSPAAGGRQVLRRRSARLARRLAEAALCRPAGYQWCRLHSDAEIRSLEDKAAARGFQIATHAIGDAANAQVIGTYEWLNSKYGLNRRWRIEHAQIVDCADLPRIGKGRMIASMQPTHQTSDRLMAEKRLDPARLKCAYAWQSMLRTGARLAFGTDFPVESPNPFPGLSAAISRQDINGQAAGGWYPQERVSFPQALTPTPVAALMPASRRTGSALSSRASGRIS